MDRSPDGSLIATGDDFRRVKIFRYPCPIEKSKFKEYKGHSEFVVNVRFSKCGKFLYTVGGLDKAVFQFEVKTGTGTGSGTGVSSSSDTFSSSGLSATLTTATTSSSSNTTKTAKGRKSRTS